MATFLNTSVMALTLIATSRAAYADDVKVGDRAADFDIATNEAGKDVRLKDYKGKWVLITFGAHWCKPCAAELPAWDTLAPTFKDKIAFVAVNISNKIDDGKKFNKKLKLKNLTKVYLPQDKSATDDQYDTGTFPSTFVIDPKGVIRYIHKGYEAGDADKLSKSLTDLLPKK
jgi:peroxiredoxin